MHARHAILRVLLEAGEDFVRLEDKDNDIVIHLDASKIKTVGVKAIHHFLLQLSILKSVADKEGAQKVFDHYTTVDEKWLQRRAIVMEQKKPRQVFIQSHTELDGDSVKIKSFESNEIGMVKSFLTRFE
jgi:dipeptidyl-peptidase-3